MKKIFAQICMVMFVGGIMLMPMFVKADIILGAPTNSQQIVITNPLNCGNSCDLTSFITLLLNNVVMPLAATAAVLYIIWAGFSYVTAQGNPKKIAEANQRLLWALIGTGVLLGAAAISQVIQTTVKSLTN